MLADQTDSSTTLPDNLLALPLWAAASALGLLSAGVAVGFIFLLTPGLSDAERSSGSELLLVSLPVLALAIGLIGASWARTERIDRMAATFLHQTVGKKLEAYLVGASSDTEGAHPYPPIFRRLERFSRSSITSFCYYRLFDDANRQFDILVKSNVYNFEVAFVLRFSDPPIGFTSAANERSYDVDSLKDWSTVITNPLIDLVGTTLHGSIAEGYTVFVQIQPEAGGGLKATYRLRQKLQSNFLTSPYLRRYFSEDAAIASYYFYSEAFSNCGDSILDGVA